MIAGGLWRVVGFEVVGDCRSSAAVFELIEEVLVPAARGVVEQRAGAVVDLPDALAAFAEGAANGRRARQRVVGLNGQ